MIFVYNVESGRLHRFNGLDVVKSNGFINFARALEFNIRNNIFNELIEPNNSKDTYVYMKRLLLFFLFAFRSVMLRIVRIIQDKNMETYIFFRLIVTLFVSIFKDTFRARSPK